MMDVLSKRPPLLDSDIDEAIPPQSFQPQIMCPSAGSQSLIFSDSGKKRFGCSYLGLQAASVVRQEVSSSCCVGR